MSVNPRPRNLRRRKALRLEHAALHDHDHAHLRGVALAVVVVALAAAGLWQRELDRSTLAPVQEAVSVLSEYPATVDARPREAAESSGHDYLPLVTVAPEYPVAAEAARISGRCTVEFTVTAAGTTRDVRPVDCHPAGVFDAAAVAAARQFKYRPREHDGDPVDVPGVRNEFIFSLEQ